MELMRHGYTNHTVSDGRVVVKTYVGPDRATRQEREERALRSLAGVLPVSELLDSVPGTTTTAFVAGMPAQDAFAAGGAAEVFTACGRLLRRVQSVDPRHVFDDVDDAAAVLVHNDFGPNNIVMTADLTEARLLCDWEWSTTGNRTTGLAWAEFIIRLHHPESVPALGLCSRATKRSRPGRNARKQWPREPRSTGTSCDGGTARKEPRSGTTESPPSSPGKRSADLFDNACSSVEWHRY